MSQPPVRLVTYAWGKEYVDKLLTFTLGSVLAPGNLPALSRVFDCSVVIVTEARFFDYVRGHPVSRRIEAICPIRLLPLDDIVGEPWQYGISLAYALFRGFSDLGPTMTDTYMLFLNADFILSDGSYEGLIPQMLDGRRVLLAPSYCVVAEQVGPILHARLDKQSHVLAIPPRELAGIILAHRHNTIRAKTINQDKVHFEYMDQAYWAVDDDTLLGHQMPISLVAMRPERALTDLSSFWDWGIVYDFCPSQQLTVLGDSDDFLMLELREEDTHLNLIRLGPTGPGECASRMLGYITPYQVDAGLHPLTLHSRDLPGSTAAAHAGLQAFVDEQSRHLLSKPKDHREHPDWLYHKEHLGKHHAEKAAKVQETPQSQRDSGAVGEAQAAEIIEDPPIPPKLVLRRLSAEPADLRKGWMLRQLQRLSSPTAPWHPMYLAYYNAKLALRDTGAGAPNILFVGVPESPLARVIASRPGTHFATSPNLALGADWDDAAKRLPGVTTTVIELSRDDLPAARKLCETLVERLHGVRRIILVWTNTGHESDESLEQGLVALVLLPGKVNFVSSARIGRAVRWVQEAQTKNLIKRAGMLSVASAEAIRAAITHRLARQGAVPSRSSLSITVIVEPAPGLR